MEEREEREVVEVVVGEEGVGGSDLGLGLGLRLALWWRKGGFGGKVYG